MRAYERFLTYAKIHTQSSEDTGVTPSTPIQWDLARVLEQELRDLGVQDVKLDEQWCIVTGHIPATTGMEHVPALGFLAHMDTAPAFSGENVNPVPHENYDGGDVVLPQEGRVILAHSREARYQTLAFVSRTCLAADETADISLFAYRGAEKEYHSMTAPAALLDALIVAVSERLGEKAAEALKTRHRLKQLYFAD